MSSRSATGASGWAHRRAWRRELSDKVVGGWQVAGNYQFYTGTPITLTGSTTSNINNTIKINQTWGSYAGPDHNLTPANYDKRFAGAVFAGGSDYVIDHPPSGSDQSRRSADLRVGRPAAEPRRVSQPGISSVGSGADEELPDLVVQVSSSFAPKPRTFSTFEASGLTIRRSETRTMGSSPPRATRRGRSSSQRA